MDTAIVREIIETQILRRGKGVEGDPVRVITQFWTKDGELLAEVDPLYNSSHAEFLTTRHQNESLKVSLKQQQDHTLELREHIDKLTAAIKWALGEADSDFGDRPHGKGAFWWRKELRERAGL